jgi:hypothetical protein
MGKITNVLNKVQESRQSNYQDQDISDLFYVKEAPHTKFRIIISVLITALIVAAVFMGYAIYRLDRSIKSQEKRTDKLLTLVVNNKKQWDDQLGRLNFRFKNEAQDRKIEIGRLSLMDNGYYIAMMESIIADKNQINYLDKYTKYLKSRIEASSASKTALPFLKK